MRGSIALTAAATVAALWLGVSPSRADEGGEAYAPPQPQKEHEWLRQLVGEWVTAGEFFMDPAAPPLTNHGTESSRMVGGFWAVFENKGDFMGAPFTGILSLGYDPESKQYIGTWFDSMSHMLWHYQGTVDAAGKVLTLEAEGPNPERPGEVCRFRESIEVKGPDHKVFTSKIEKDGEWVTMMRITYTRKK